ncbi:molybdopterin molybdotransferase MoeA [Streptomyces sp. NPDC093109]|uniref:molybdopterin molybdotransferase MoeA n=1 Tax=Streptomyces sp. NPDC093109 TaxID=3154977 RepID=UPI00344B6425
MTGHDGIEGIDGIDGIEDVLALVGREPVVARAPGGDSPNSPNSPHSPPSSGADRRGAPADVPHERRERHRAASWTAARALAARAGRSAKPGPTPGRVPLDQALGRALAEPLAALTDLPSFDTSAMDGWAVSGPGPWSVRSVAPAGTDSAAAGILAGHGRSAALADGTAVRIATGARIPPDTTAVIRSEHARVDATGHLHAERRAVTQGQDIRPRGQECRSGDRLLPAGAPVTPAVLGLAAAAGYDELLTVPPPRVEVLVLGDELLAAGIPHDGLIRDALGPMMAPWLRALGAEVIATRRLGDDAEALYGAITASEADLILTTGGTAAGPVDHVHPVLARVGAELLVDGVAVRPGHPMLLAALPSGRYLVGLPGNPLAAVSGLLTLAEPLLRTLAGRAPRTPYHAPLRDAVPGHPYDTRLVPFVHHDEGLVPLRFHGPAMLRGIAAADGLAVVAPGGARSGDELEVLDLPWTASVDGGCFT